MTGNYILAIDEGSSSARAVIVDRDGRTVADASRVIEAQFPNPGWVELSPADLWDAPRACIEDAMKTANLTANDIAAVGVTTHRETIVMWDRATGKPVYNAIMWMSKQTEGIVREWSERGLDEEFRRRTGVRELKVDGGATQNNLLCQFQADILDIPVIRPLDLERTVLGIAHLAGAGAGFWSIDSITDRWILDRTFEPRMDADQRESLYAGWCDAVAAARTIPNRG